MHRPRVVWIAAMLLLLVSGCAAADRVTETEFTPVDGGFRYRAKASASYPEDSLGAEQQRLAWLQQYVGDAKLCPNGYAIIKRTAVLQSRAILADIYDIFYDGRCN
jgi:hypothetical protein